MTAYGYTLTPDQEQAMLAAMQGFFRLYDVERAAANAGVPRGKNEPILMRLADRPMLAEWEERHRFCVAETEKYRRATHGRREWEARASSVRRCLDELKAYL